MTRHHRRAVASLLSPNAPTLERQQHDPIVLAPTMLDDRGEISQPYRVRSLLDRMVDRGAIGDRERAAGELFQGSFRVAAVGGIRAMDWAREVRHQAANESLAALRAREERDLAMDALGGHRSPCGCCAWFVLGEEMTIAEWARREGWSGRPLREEVAKGILVGALGVLVEHYRL